MKELNNKEMESIYAGSISAVGWAAIIAGIISFVSGILDGYTRPYECRYKGASSSCE